jgi:hypothetical protein
MTRTLRKTLLLGVLSSALLASAPAVAEPTVATEASGCANASAAPNTVSVAAARRSTRCLLNQERRRRGLRPLRRDRRLARAA